MLPVLTVNVLFPSKALLGVFGNIPAGIVKIDER